MSNVVRGNWPLSTFVQTNINTPDTIDPRLKVKFKNRLNLVAAQSDGAPGLLRPRGLPQPLRGQPQLAPRPPLPLPAAGACPH